MVPEETFTLHLSRTRLKMNSIILLIVCIAGRVLSNCNTPGMLECENLYLINEPMLIRQEDLGTVCPLFPAMFECLEKNLRSCEMTRNIFWMVRRNVFEYICHNGTQAYLASTDCFVQHNADNILTFCESQLQMDLVKPACPQVEKFVACGQRQVEEHCGDPGGCVMKNILNAYVNVVKDFIKCPEKSPMTTCTTPDIPTSSASLTQTSAATSKATTWSTSKITEASAKMTSATSSSATNSIVAVKEIDYDDGDLNYLDDSTTLTGRYTSLGVSCNQVTVWSSAAIMLFLRMIAGL